MCEGKAGPDPHRKEHGSLLAVVLGLEAGLWLEALLDRNVQLARVPEPAGLLQNRGLLLFDKTRACLAAK